MDNNYQKEAQQEDIFDEELQAMGIPYEDETEPTEMPRMEQKSRNADNTDSNADVRVERVERVERVAEAKAASWHPIRDQKTGLQERLLGCMKWIGICGGISMLLWWFQINDLMAMQAAYPCIVACGILGGFGVGKNAMK